MNNRTKYLGTGLVTLVLIIAVLFYNKSRMAAEAKNDVITTVPVSVTVVKQRPLHDVRAFTGTIAANNDVAIISETQGKVTAVLADVGDVKSAGAGLVQVDSELKKAAMEAAEVSFAKAKNDRDRYESLQKDSAVTAQQLEGARLAYKSAEAQLVIARREYNDTRISTPIDGVVSARLVDVGSYVQRGTPVANVVDVSKMKVKVGVPEEDVFYIRNGDAAEVTTDVYPGVILRGTVLNISDKADEAHTYAVEVKLPNTREHPLKAGMFGRVSFPSRTDRKAVVIPRGALLGSTRNPQVFVVVNGRADQRTLVLGQMTGDEVEVLTGLSEGETIIINGQNNVQQGASVTVVHQE
ncbi:MAG TPA: efflux RND transporter periplasmic adaptor subunit [Bacteroidota bacterium]|nr:efflux RND transporter periplasmic adaptor subunit [Bacteroidota bacterium]